MYLWRAVDDEGEALDVVVQRRKDTDAALKLLRRLPRNQPVEPEKIVTDGRRPVARPSTRGPKGWSLSTTAMNPCLASISTDVDPWGKTSRI